MPPQLSQLPPALNLSTTGATLLATLGKTVHKSCAGALPTGRLLRPLLVATVPSWLLKLHLHLLLLLLLLLPLVLRPLHPHPLLLHHVQLPRHLQQPPK